jgi:thioredoxin 1
MNGDIDMADVKELTNNNFKEEVIDNEGVVLVDFYAQWCGPCKVLTPSIIELSDEFSGMAKVCKADVEENSDIVGDLGISSVPAIVIFKSGSVVSRATGVRSKEDMKSDIEEAFNG